MSQVGRVHEVVLRVDQCVSAVRAVKLPVPVCLRSSCSHVTDMRAVRFVRLALKDVMQNDGDFVDVMLLYVTDKAHQSLRWHRY